MCSRAHSRRFIIECSRFLCVKVCSLAMMMSIFLKRLAAIVFDVMSVGSIGKRLPHLFTAVCGNCYWYSWCSCVSRCYIAVCASGFVSAHV